MFSAFFAFEKHLMANEVADQIADLLFGETQSSQRPQRNAKGSGGVRWREEVEVDNGGFIWYKKNVVRGRGNNGVFVQEVDCLAEGY